MALKITRVKIWSYWYFESRCAVWLLRCSGAIFCDHNETNNFSIANNCNSM